MRWLHISFGALLGIVFMVSCSVQQDGEGILFDAMGNVVAAISMLAEEVGFNNINTQLSADNIQDALEEEDEKVENLKGDVENLQNDVNDLKVTTANTPLYYMDCPADMQKVGDHCVERNRRAQLDYQSATSTCASSGRRMCSLDELITYCQVAESPDFNNGKWEWSSSTYPYQNQNWKYVGSTLALQNNSCTSYYTYKNYLYGSFDITNGNHKNEFRCCSALELRIQ